MPIVLWTCLELSANLFDSFLCVHFIISSFNKKCKVLGLKTTYLIGIIFLTAIVTIFNNIMIFEGLVGAIYVAEFLAFSVIFLRGSFGKKVFISALTIICLISTAAISGNILLVIFKDDPARIYTKLSFERFTFMVLGLSIRAYVFAFMQRFTRGRDYFLKAKEWALILSVLGISFFMLAMIQTIMISNKTDPASFVVIELGIIIINTLCLYITANLSETHKREYELLIEQKRNEYSQQYAQNIKEQYEQTRRLRHDIKQYSVTLLALIQERKIDAAEQLAKNQTLDISQNETIIRVDNDFVNAILNTKLAFAKSQGIDIFCSVEDGISDIEDIDLCNLLGNLLDNAITASEKCEKGLRLIEVNILASGKRLIVTVKNSIQSSVLKVNPKLESTKQNSEEHGFGIQTIKYIAEKYDGSTDFYEEGLTFICRVELHKRTEIK